MAKFFGKIGYTNTEETTPGVWGGIVERQYYGNVLERRGGWIEKESTNDDITIRQRISIVADPFAYENFSRIRYVEFMGTRWNVSDISVEYPRLILTIGGVYNGPKAGTT